MQLANWTGERFGQYELIQILGRGGFATVYLGRNVQLSQQLVAVKILEKKMIGEKSQQFKREAATILTLIHPHIIRFYTYDVYENTAQSTTQYPYIVMEYAPNGSLRQKHSRGTQLDLDTIMQYTRQIVDALEYSHGNQVMHLDVKPENILINAKGHLLLSDFGLATLAEEKNNAREIQGTASYMSPEQLLGRPEKASDQYALGIMIYEWLCGQLPFTGRTAEEVAQKQLQMSPPPLHSLNPHITPAVEAVVLKALAKEARQRYASVTQFLANLEKAVALPLVVSDSPQARQTTPLGQEQLLLPAASSAVDPADKTEVEQKNDRHHPGQQEQGSQRLEANLPQAPGLPAPQPTISPSLPGPVAQPAIPHTHQVPNLPAAAPILQATPLLPAPSLAAQVAVPPTQGFALVATPHAAPQPSPFQPGPPPASPLAAPPQAPAGQVATPLAPQPPLFQPGPPPASPITASPPQTPGATPLPAPQSPLFQPGPPPATPVAVPPPATPQPAPFQPGPPPVLPVATPPTQPPIPLAPPPPAAPQPATPQPAPFQPGPPPTGPGAGPAAQVLTASPPVPQVPQAPLFQPGPPPANFQTIQAPQLPPFQAGTPYSPQGGVILSSGTNTFPVHNNSTTFIHALAPDIAPYPVHLKKLTPQKPSPGNLLSHMLARMIQLRSRRRGELPVFLISGLTLHTLGSILVGIWLIQALPSYRNERAWWGFIFSLVYSLPTGALFALSENKRLKYCLAVAIACFWAIAGAALGTQVATTMPFLPDAGIMAVIFFLGSLTLHLLITFNQGKLARTRN